MRVMREGGAWADSLAMDASDGYAGAGAAPTSAAFGAPNAAGGYDMALATLTQQQAQQGQRRAAEEQERATPPGVAALLMHPGGRGGGACGMIPIAQEQPLSASASLACVPDCGPAQSAAASLQQQRPSGGGIGGWPAMQQPMGYSLPMPGPPQAPPPFAFYQTAPASFGGHLMAQQQMQGQAQHFVGAGAAGAEPHSSGDGSDGTTMRRSFDSDDRSHNRQHSFQPQQQAAQHGGHHGGGHHHHAHTHHVHQRGGHHQHQQPAQAHHTHLASAAPAQQLCSAHALAAFDQAAFDCQAATGPACAAPPTVKCEAPSDSSDVEDFGGRRPSGLRRQNTHLQVRAAPHGPWGLAGRGLQLQGAGNWGLQGLDFCSAAAALGLLWALCVPC
jgi:hypothetical protein